MKSFSALLILLLLSNGFAASNENKSTLHLGLKAPEHISTRKNLTGAVILETLVPTLGFKYAHNWKAGLLPNLTSFSGIALMLTQANLYNPNKNPVQKSNFLFYSGLLLYIGGKIWVYSALIDAVDSYNQSVQIGLDAPGPINHQTLCLSIRYAF